VAEPMTVLVSGETAHALPPDQARVTRLGARRVKGFHEEIELFLLDGWGRKTAPRRQPDAPLIGRDEELARLRRAFAEAQAGQGRFILLVGDAGVGKSRLVQEIGLEATLRAGLVLEGHCVPFGASAAYEPWRAIVQGLLGVR